MVLGHLLQEQRAELRPRAASIRSMSSSVSRPGIAETGTPMSIQAMASSERSSRVWPQSASFWVMTPVS